MAGSWWAALLAGTALASPLAAVAQNAQWLANPGSADFGTASNWSSGSVPTGIASFGASDTTLVVINSPQTVGTLAFQSAAPAYTLVTTASLQLTGSGIVNQSGVSQAVVSAEAGGSLTFSNSASASDARIFSGTPALITFADTSSAGTASITNSGTLCFCNDASAASASIDNTGRITFTGRTSAATSTLLNRNPGVINFTADSTGASARYIGDDGILDISQLSSGGTTLASIEGTGLISLGRFNLAVGATGTSTSFRGLIEDGGTGGGTGGSLTKTGSGILTLTRSNSYSGGTTVTGGLINFVAADNLGTGTITLNGGGLQWASGNTADISSRLAPLGAGGGIFDIRNNNVTLASTISGPGGLTKIGSGMLSLTGANSYQGGTTIDGGTLAVSADSNLGAAAGGVTINGGTLRLRGTFSSNRTLTIAGGVTIDTGIFDGRLGGTIAGTGGLIKSGTDTLTLTGNNTYTGGTTILNGLLEINGGSIGGDVVANAGFALVNADASRLTSVTTNGGFSTVTGTTLGNIVVTNNQRDSQAGVTLFLDNSSAGSALIVSNGFGVTSFSQNSTAGNATVVTNAGTFVTFGNGATGGQARIVTNAGGTFDMSFLTSGGMTVGSIEGAGTYRLGSKQLTVGGNGLSTTVTGTIVDGGSQGGTRASLVKVGSGTLALSGANTYTGGTTVAGGLINFTTAANFGTGRITLNGGGLQWATGSTADVSSMLAPLGAFGGTLDTNGNNVVLATALSGPGGLTKQGMGELTLTGNNTYAGQTVVLGGTLAVNGSLAGPLVIGSAGTLGGNGTFGSVVSNGGTLAPGNSIGTLTVTGNLVQNGGAYQVEANAQGQNDRINVGGTATINGGTVAVLAQPGAYTRNTTYTILTASGGLTGSYSTVTSNFAFLTPSLAYDANNAYLSLFMNQHAFASGARTANQYAVGNGLDRAYVNASGDLAMVMEALSVLNTQQGPWALNQISGQPYADFGTANVAANTLFMNALGQQMALARGGAGSGQRQALALACDIAACETASPFSVWASGLGGFGNVQGNGNAGSFTYNLGGAAAGIDYRVMSNLLLGVGAGYTSGAQWVDGFSGKGWTNAVSLAAYGSFTESGFYADLLAGYAYSGNQLQRQLSIPGLPSRTANGSTGANQFLGQAEVGYQVPVYAPAAATLTPFARLQVVSVNQAAFQEGGASSLSLNVQQQTTNSVRSTLGAVLGGTIGLDDTRTLDMTLRLGWLHEHAYTGRPVTAAFAGTPTSAFTVYGAAPQRDAAAIGFSASMTVAEAAQLYFRYDGDIGSGTDNHALNIGLRLTW